MYSFSSVKTAGIFVLYSILYPDAKGHLHTCFYSFEISDNKTSVLLLFCRYLTGQVDKRTLEKYEREAKEKNRETWYLSWALDTNQEERDKVGKKT